VPPEDLAARVREALGATATQEAEFTVVRCLDAMESLLVSLKDDDAAGRERALDLLAADALVTYAFEAAAESEDLAEIAEGAMWRVGEVAAELEP
jgi:hypothetical protein